MSYLLDIAACGLTLIIEFTVIIVAALLIQLIAYQIFGINIYKGIFKGLNKLDRYLSKVI